MHNRVHIEIPIKKTTCYLLESTLEETITITRPTKNNIDNWSFDNTIVKGKKKKNGRICMPEEGHHVDTTGVWVRDPHQIWSTYLGCLDYIHDQGEKFRLIYIYIYRVMR